MLLAQAERDDPVHAQGELIEDDPWERWNRFRTFCHVRITSLSLDVTELGLRSWAGGS